MSGPFFDGPFFGGGFFGELEEQAAEETRARPGDQEGKKRRSIYKPTGLPPYTRVVQRPTVEQGVQETHEIALEVSATEPETPVAQMSIAQIDAEIGALLRKKIRTEDEEIMLLLLLVAAA